MITWATSRIWQNKFISEGNKINSPIKAEDYPKVMGHSKEEFDELCSYHNRLNSVESMFTSFLLTIVISRFVDISKRYKLTHTGTEILQKIVMDQISKFLDDILVKSGVSDEDFDSNLNSTWRQIVYSQLGSKILNDIYDFYTDNDITIDGALRTRIRHAFWNTINLLNPPPLLIDTRLERAKIMKYNTPGHSTPVDSKQEAAT